MWLWPRHLPLCACLQLQQGDKNRMLLIGLLWSINELIYSCPWHCNLAFEDSLNKWQCWLLPPFNRWGSWGLVRLRGRGRTWSQVSHHSQYSRSCLSVASKDKNKQMGISGLTEREMRAGELGVKDTETGRGQRICLREKRTVVKGVGSGMRIS